MVQRTTSPANVKSPLPPRPSDPDATIQPLDNPAVGAHCWCDGNQLRRLVEQASASWLHYWAEEARAWLRECGYTWASERISDLGILRVTGELFRGGLAMFAYADPAVTWAQAEELAALVQQRL